MASGFVIPAGDLDSLLAPLGSFTPRAAVGFQVSGTDIANRYAPASYGTPYGATGFVCPAGDIGNLFAAFGSAGGYSGTVTAGTIVAFQSWGFINGSVGSITPTTFRGHTIQEIAANTTSNQTIFSIQIASSPGIGYFTTLKFSTATFPSSSAFYSYSGGVASWTFPGAAISGTGSYPLIIT